MGGQNRWKTRIKKNAISAVQNFGLAPVIKFTVTQNTTRKSRNMRLGFNG